MKKVCIICNQSKPGNDFYINRKSKDGLNSYCKKCDNEMRALKPTSKRKPKQPQVKKLDKKIEVQPAYQINKKSELEDSAFKVFQELRKRDQKKRLLRAKETDITEIEVVNHVKILKDQNCSAVLKVKANKIILDCPTPAFTTEEKLLQFIDKAYQKPLETVSKLLEVA